MPRGAVWTKGTRETNGDADDCACASNVMRDHWDDSQLPQSEDSERTEQARRLVNEGTFETERAIDCCFR
jgi:hypothetical protein